MEGRRNVSTVPVALFASGSGSNVAALLDHRYTGAVRPHYRCLIGNNSGAGAMALARERGVAAYHVSSRTHPRPREFAARLRQILRCHEVELIVLAGYLKRLPAELVRCWRGRILNIHPALLPRHGGPGMYGLAPHRAVLAAGERTTGVTVHWVTEKYDAGPILLQRVVAVQAGDTAQTLARRVLAVEHDTYWRAVEQVVTGLAAVREPGLPDSDPTADRTAMVPEWGAAPAGEAAPAGAERKAPGEWTASGATAAAAARSPGGTSKACAAALAGGTAGARRRARAVDPEAV